MVQAFGKYVKTLAVSVIVPRLAVLTLRLTVVERGV